MNYNFLKIAAIPALFALAAFGIIACGETEEHIVVPPPAESSSSALPVYSSVVVTEVSPIRFQEFTVTPNNQKTIFKFGGSATLDLWDTLANADTIPDQRPETADPFFTNIQLDLVYVNGDVVSVPPFALTYTPIDFSNNSVTTINLSEMNVTLSDPDKFLCGTFRIYVNLFATNDPALPEKFVSKDSLTFEREAEFCKEEEPIVSSSSAPVSTVELAYGEAKISTSPALGLSLKTGAQVAAAEAEIKLTLGEGDALILTALNGYKITEYANSEDTYWDDDWYSEYLPPEPVHLSDFRFFQSKLGEDIEGFDVDKFYIVIGPNYNEETGDDFYALTLKEKSNINEAGLMTAEIIYYKKK